jgi:hypothetical protein
MTTLDNAASQVFFHRNYPQRRNLTMCEVFEKYGRTACFHSIRVEQAVKMLLRALRGA